MSIFKNPDAKIKINARNRIDGLELLSYLNEKCIAVTFFDPQYRGVLDKLKYGNEGVLRDKARSSLPQMDEFTIIKFIILGNIGIKRKHS